MWAKGSTKQKHKRKKILEEFVKVHYSCLSSKSSSYMGFNQRSILFQNICVGAGENTKGKACALMHPTTVQFPALQSNPKYHLCHSLLSKEQRARALQPLGVTLNPILSPQKSVFAWFIDSYRIFWVSSSNQFLPLKVINTKNNLRRWASASSYQIAKI